MKERIVSALMELSQDKNPVLLKDLVENEGFQAFEIKANARKTLSLILHDYSRFGVSTIDSFTYKVIKNFTRDLDLPNRFDVEMDSEALLARIIDQLMDSIGRDAYVTRILTQFAEEKVSQETAWNVERDVLAIAKSLFDEDSQVPIGKLKDLGEDTFLDFIKYVKVKKDEYPERIAQLGKEATDLIESMGMSVNDFSFGKNGPAMRLYNIQEKNVSPANYEKWINSGRFVNAVEQDKWSKKGLESQVEPVLSAGLRVKAQEIRAYHLEEYSNFLTAWYAYKNIHSLAVIKQVEDLIDEYKERNNVVHISDFNRKIAEFIENEPPEYLYWRLGERYHHYLLDEFQDTSILQWKNLSPLFDHLKSGAHADGTILLVGDSKQAIYRWRGGQVELMENEAPASFGIEPDRLGTNYRSKEAIVKFNNDFFDIAANLLTEASPLIGQIYEKGAQEVRSGNEDGGFVRLSYIEKGASKAEYNETAKDTCLKTIQELTQEGFRLQDIAILVRGKKEGSEMARFLAEKKIDVISSDSLLLYREPVIAFIVSLFHYLVDPRDNLIRAEVLYYHLFQSKEEAGQEAHLQIKEILEDEHSIRRTNDFLPQEFLKLRYQLDQLALYELAEEVIRIFGLHDRSQAYLQHFLDVCLDFSDRQKPDLAGFLEEWEDRKEKYSLVIPEGEEAVRIMTLHKSKGLQFPVVIMPFVNWGISPRSDNYFWASAGEGYGEFTDSFLVPTHKDLKASRFGEDYREEWGKTFLDNLNMLYVGFTRPEERLYICTEAPKIGKTGKKTVEEMSNIAQLIHSILDDERFGSIEELEYERGFEETYETKSVETATPPVKDFPGLPWRGKIRIDRKVQKYWDPEDADDPAPELSPGVIQAEIFKRLKDKESLPQLLVQMQEEGLLDEQEATEMGKVVEGLLFWEPQRSWFEKGVAKRPGSALLSRKGDIYEPGRIIIQDKKAIVVDFLAGVPEPAHAKQMRKYGVLLEALGFEEVERWVLYVKLGEARRV